MNATLTTHRSLFGPFKWVGLEVKQGHTLYGLIVFDDGRIDYEFNHRSVDSLPDDGLADCLIGAYHDHREEIENYLASQVAEAWYALSMSIEGFLRKPQHAF